MASKEQSVILKKEDLADVPSGFWDKGLFQEPVEVADIVSTSAPTRRHRVVRKDHGVFAQHNKFGTFEVPKTFLNNDKEAVKCAAEVAEKQAAKKAVKQSKTAQKTKKEASAEQAKAVPSKAVRATPSKVESSAVSFRTLALLGVAAVFGASLTQPSALGSTTHEPVVTGVACSPQWLPLLMGQGVEKDLTLTTGWQMISFDHLPEQDSFKVIRVAKGFSTDDVILSRQGGRLVTAAFDGNKWQGILVKQGLSLAQGYKVKAKSGAVITQMGVNQVPVANVVLTKGWNWIGHAPLQAIDVNNIKPVDGSGQFSANDQIKTRSTDLLLTTYNGKKWVGKLKALEQGNGYEILVKNKVTFQYVSPPSAPSPSPSPPPLSPSPGDDGGDDGGDDDDGEDDDGGDDVRGDDDDGEDDDGGDEDGGDEDGGDDDAGSKFSCVIDEDQPAGVYQAYVCDGEADCEDGSDELGCDTYTCSWEQYRCDVKGVSLCIPACDACDGGDGDNYLCDGEVHCDDGSDELCSDDGGDYDGGDDDGGDYDGGDDG